MGRKAKTMVADKVVGNVMIRGDMGPKPGPTHSDNLAADPKAAADEKAATEVAIDSGKKVEKEVIKTTKKVKK